MARHLSALISQLKGEGVLKHRRVITALKKIDRKDFVLPKYKNDAYGDYPLPIGFHQTSPQPYATVFTLEHLAPRKNERILEIGAGSGWAAALLGDVVGKKGHVYTVERIPSLVTLAQNNITKYNLPQVSVHTAGSKLGLPEHAPYDRILVSAGTDMLPNVLVEQLKVGGTMVIPLGDTLCRITKTSPVHTDIERFKGFSFVPLVH